MSGIILRGNNSKALLPGVKRFFGADYAQRADEYLALFDKETSQRAYEEYVSQVGLGMAQVKDEGDHVAMDTMRDGFTTRLTSITRGLGFSISREAIADNQYKKIMEVRSKQLSRITKATLNTIGALVYDRAGNSSYLGGDGVSLVNSAHPFITGGTWSNALSTAAELSEAALEQAYIEIGDWKDEKGIDIAAVPKTLIVPRALTFEAERIMKTDKTVGSANNDANVVRGMIGQVHVNNFLDDSNNWFLRTDIEGMRFVEREAPVVDTDNDWGTTNAQYKVMFRCAFGWDDPHALFGSLPA